MKLSKCFKCNVKKRDIKTYDGGMCIKCYYNEPILYCLCCKNAYTSIDLKFDIFLSYNNKNALLCNSCDNIYNYKFGNFLSKKILQHNIIKNTDWYIHCFPITKLINFMSNNTTSYIELAYDKDVKKNNFIFTSNNWLFHQKTRFNRAENFIRSNFITTYSSVEYYIDENVRNVGDIIDKIICALICFKINKVKLKLCKPICKLIINLYLGI